MLSRSEIKSLEQRFGFRPQKRLGQNFLIDGNIKNKLLDAAELKKTDLVLEIGPGLGQLTFDIALRAKEVIAVEFDKKLFSILNDSGSDYKNIKFIHQDFLKSDLPGLIPHDKKIKVISNLPYYISTPIILKLLENRKRMDFALLTLQKEVADRLTAKPNSKNYGSLTLFASFYAEIKKLFNIKKNSFYPVPKVDSAVIILKPRISPPVKVTDHDILLELIRTGFSSRRKTLINALSSKNFRGLSKDAIQHILSESGVPENIRAEALSLADFAAISDRVSGLQG
ncbi:MAG: 16S rRNA (adenine(1518)-N(6)/adenine(1519)-N(6))-dimethyltransferase RsmA [Candidatus Omnitrophica bacterium]|nr:16S rRNA (adenine(1518)-N(6)/adenine(1519)-N(6))-dimethyltransferase RsmA [Candidatus Omnitrophota bacterium]